MWSVWWVWIAAGLVLAVLEMLLPGWILLGFALGAVATGLLLLAGGPAAAALGGNFALVLLFFALASLGAWVVLRRVLGNRSGQVKTFDRDINDD